MCDLNRLVPKHFMSTDQTPLVSNVLTMSDACKQVKLKMCLFVGLWVHYDLYSPSITAVMYAVSCYMVPWYNSTQLYCNLVLSYRYHVCHIGHIHNKIGISSLYPACLFIRGWRWHIGRKHVVRSRKNIYQYIRSKSWVPSSIFDCRNTVYLAAFCIKQYQMLLLG